MTFGGVHSNLKGDARFSMQSNRVGIIDKSRKPLKSILTEDLILTQCDTVVYNPCYIVMKNKDLTQNDLY